MCSAQPAAELLVAQFLVEELEFQLFCIALKLSAENRVKVKKGSCII